MRAANQAGIDIIKRFESLRLTAYLCPAGIPTIGYGSTKDVIEGMEITPREAELRLVADLRDAAHAVEAAVTVELTDNRFGALVSFAYNIGGGAFKKSTLLRKLNAGDYSAVPGELAKWCRGGGKVLAGLEARRKAEGELFNRAQA